MLAKDTPIRQKLINANLITSGMVLLITCLAFFAYELHRFHLTTERQLAVLSKVIATNSTAALAFDSPAEGKEILEALKADPHIVSAILYDETGKHFCSYGAVQKTDSLAEMPDKRTFWYHQNHLEWLEPVQQGDNRLGTLYLKSDLKAMDERLRLYGLIVLGVILITSLLAYLLSQLFEKSISRPVHDLAKTAQAVSEKRDYTVRARKWGQDELGLLTDTFNHMLEQIQVQNEALQAFNQRLELKVQERTQKLEIAIREQKEAEQEVQRKNNELSAAIEELQHTEEQLVNLNDELEQRVEDRTRELQESEDRLRLKNQELERTNIDLDNFIYTASHDLRSPILNLEGLVMLIKKKLQAEDGLGAMSLLDRIDLSVSKLKATINDLAEITKVQKDLEEESTLVPIKEMLEDIKADIHFEIEGSGASIQETLEVEHLLYPRNNLRSILYNLLSNAIKYRSPERPLRIDITTYREEDYIVLSVADNGLGISHHQQPKLFSMFKRFHAHVEGTGIGLYMIKRIVENRGGRITFESQEGVGTTFKVYLLATPLAIA